MVPPLPPVFMTRSPVKSDDIENPVDTVLPVCIVVTVRVPPLVVVHCPPLTIVGTLGNRGFRGRGGCKRYPMYVEVTFR